MAAIRSRPDDAGGGVSSRQAEEHRTNSNEVARSRFSPEGFSVGLVTEKPPRLVPECTNAEAGQVEGCEKRGLDPVTQRRLSRSRTVRCSTCQHRTGRAYLAHPSERRSEIRRVVVLDDGCSVVDESHSTCLEAQPELDVLELEQGLVKASGITQKGRLRGDVCSVEEGSRDAAAIDDLVERELYSAAVKPIHERRGAALWRPNDVPEQGCFAMGILAVKDRVASHEI